MGSVQIIREGGLFTYSNGEDIFDSFSVLFTCVFADSSYKVTSQNT